MKHSNTNYAARNALTAITGFAVKTIAGFIVTPMLVNGLGDIYYGVLQFIQKVMGFVTNADARPTQAMKWFISTNQGKEYDYEKKKIIGKSVHVWLYMLPIQLFIGLVVMYYLPSMLGDKDMNVSIVRISFLIMLINTIYSGIILIPSSILRGMNKAYLGVSIVVSTTVLGTVLVIAAIKLNYGLIGVVSAYTLQSLISAYIYYYIVKKQFKWFGYIRPDNSEIKSFLKSTIWYALWAIVYTLNMSSSILIVGILYSAEVVTPLSITAYMPRLVIVLYVASTGATMPGFGKHFSSMNFIAIQKYRKEIQHMSFFMLGMIIPAVILYNKIFITLWVGELRYLGTLSNILLLIWAMQMVYLKNEAMMIDLTLNVSKKVLYGLFSLATTILLSLLLASVMQINGVILASIVGNMWMIYGFTKGLNRYIKIKETHSVGHIVRPMGVMIALLIVSYLLRNSTIIHVNNWIALVIQATVVVCLSGAIMYLCGIPFQYKEAMKNRLKAAVK